MAEFNYPTNELRPYILYSVRNSGDPRYLGKVNIVYIITYSLNTGNWSLKVFGFLANHECELIGFESRRPIMFVLSFFPTVRVR